MMLGRSIGPLIKLTNLFSNRFLSPRSVHSNRIVVLSLASAAAASWEGFITSKEAMIADVDRGGTFTGARFYVSDCARPYRCET